jgi:signal transduction histidine kinase
MQMDGTREHYREVVASMLEEVNRLTRLVESLLTMSRADAGQVQLRPSVFPMMELARESSQLFEVLLEEKNQRLTITGDEEVRVEGDRLFLRQALVNLIHNAIKFSPLGGNIGVKVRTEESSKVWWRLATVGRAFLPNTRRVCLIASIGQINPDRATRAAPDRGFQSRVGRSK